MDKSLTSFNLDALTSIAVATLDRTGVLIEANAGFLRLIHQDGRPPSATHVEQYFIQPTFAQLVDTPPASDGEIHRGLLTLGEYTGHARSLSARIWREGDRLRLLAEHDIATLERLSDSVLQSNREYAQAQFQLTQANHALNRRERELRRSLADREAANLQLRTTQRQLIEAEKMAALGVMVAGVAHEINTPLGVSQGSASLLEQQSQVLAQRFAERRMTQSELEDYLQHALAETRLIRANLERIGNLTESLRELAVGDRTTAKRRFNFKRCIDDVIASLSERQPATALTFRVACEPAFELDSFPEEWAMIFTNLFSNSLQHAFTGRDHGTIAIDVTVDADTLRVDYTDDGAGLSTEALSRVFEPFFTTNRRHGMGLGMYLIYNLVTQRLRGSITCDGAPGQGAHFRIEIPL